MNKKAFIFIDGSNLYFKLKEFRKKLNKDLRLLNFNFRKFSEFLAGENKVIEMIRFARQNKYDVAYLLSSDTDLVPAIEEVQAFGKAVQYVGFAKAQSFGLTVVANDIKLLRPEDIEQFFEK